MFRLLLLPNRYPTETTRHSVVIAIREKDTQRVRKESKRPGGGGGRFRGRDEAVQDRGGKGNEIAKEVSACPACAEKHHEAETIAAPEPPVAEAVAVAAEAETTAADATDAKATDAKATEAKATE